MSFEELTEHLFNIKILSHTDKYKLSIHEYFESISSTIRLETELRLKESNNVLDNRTAKSIIDKSGKESFTIFKDKTVEQISNLLQKGGIEDPLFGSIGINLNNLLEVLTAHKHSDLKEYIFGKSRTTLIGIFGKKTFDKDFSELKTDDEILGVYTRLNELKLGISFVDYLKLLESLKLSLTTSLNQSIHEIKNILKGKNNEAKTEYLRPLKNSLTNQINKSSYIVVSEVANYDYSTTIDLSTFLYTFSKINNLPINIIKSEITQLMNFFKNIFLSTYLDKEFTHIIKPTILDDDEVFALIQNKNKLNQIVYPDNIDLFSDVEKQLIREEFFNKNGTWIKEKLALVKFITHCSTIGYFNISLNKAKHIRDFFETRYNINISKQFQPKEREKAKKFNISFNWIKQPR